MKPSYDPGARGSGYGLSSYIEADRLRDRIRDLEADNTRLRLEVQAAGQHPSRGPFLSETEIRALLRRCHPDVWNHDAAAEITSKLVQHR